MPFADVFGLMEAMLSGRSGARDRRAGHPERGGPGSRRAPRRRTPRWAGAPVACAVLLALAWAPAAAQTTSVYVGAGQNPVRVAVNPVTNRIYVAGRATTTIKQVTFCNVTSVVTVIDGATNATTTVPVGICPSAIGVNPVTNKVYVLNEYSYNVMVIDGASQTVTKTVSVGTLPQSLAINAVTNTIYVTNLGDGTVSVIDGATDSVVATIAAGTNPGPIAVNPATNTVYVANAGDLFTAGSVTIIDAANGNATTTRLVPSQASNRPGAQPVAIAVNPATNLIYVPYRTLPDAVVSEGVMVIDGGSTATTFQQTPNVPISGPGVIVVNPVTNKVYVTNGGGGNVAVIDWPTFNSFPTAVTVPIPGSDPLSIALDAATNTIAVGTRFGGAVTLIDGATNATSQAMDVAAFQPGIAVNPVSGKIYVANGPDNNVTVISRTPGTATVAVGSGPQAIGANPVTNTVFVANADGNNVTVIDGATGATTTVPTGANPIALEVNPATNQVFVANANGGNVTVIDAGNGYATQSVVAGLEPNGLAVNPVTNKVYVANAGGFFTAGTLVEIDAGNGYATRTIGQNAFFLTVAVNPATNMIYAGNCTGRQLLNLTYCSVTVIDGVTGTAVAGVPLGSAPTAIRVDPATNRIYAAANNVTVIDGATNTAIAKVSQGGPPLTLAVNPMTSTVYVANFSNAEVTVIAEATNQATTVPVGQNTTPTGVAVDMITNTVYVADDSQPGAVTLIDGATLATTSVPAGNQPYSVAVNAVTGTAYASNNQGGTVTVIARPPRAAVPLTTAIGPLPDDQTSDPTPTFTLTARSGFAPNATVPDAVYVQVDSQQGAWTRAAAAGAGTFTATTAALVPGFHTLFAFATDGQDAAGRSSPLIGSIAAYVFLVTPATSSGVGEPVVVALGSASGKAQNVGVAKDSGNLRISGRFTAPAGLRLGLGAVTIDALLDEQGGAGELSRRSGGAALLPIVLAPRAGNKPADAIYETPSGARPSVKLEIKTRDAKTGVMEVSITVDRDSMPVRPARCAGSPSRTRLLTSFTVGGVSARPVVVAATLPWECRGNELRLP